MRKREEALIKEREHEMQLEMLRIVEEERIK
jgi:hypothetical protein